MPTHFPTVNPEIYHQALRYPFPEHADVLIDTDIANELDDQYALAMALMAREAIDLRAITIAPFIHHPGDSPREGMIAGISEAKHQLECFNAADIPVMPGAERFLDSAATPVDSPAVRKIIELAHETARAGRRLYVIGIAAATNIASALLIDPELNAIVTVVWLGGHAPWCRNAAEFNLLQDVTASRILLESGVPLVLVPCHGVAELLGTSLYELRQLTAGTGAAGRFLYNRAFEVMNGNFSAHRILWDVATVALFVTPDSLLTTVEPTPELDEKFRFHPGTGTGRTRMVRYLYRDEIFEKLFGRLKKQFEEK